MSSQTNPQISVIIPCLNRKQFIGECLDSIRAQIDSSHEVIVIDGGSTDGTQDIISQYPEVKLVSEKDHGLYDAMNKGLRLARGSIIAFLNSDDILPKQVFSAVLTEFNNNPEIDCVTGQCAVFEETLREPPTYLKIYDSQERLRISLGNAAFNFLAPNARFFHRRVFEKVGPFRWDYSISGDREFLIRLILSKAVNKTVYLEKIVMLYRWHSGSLTFSPNAPRELITDEHLRMIPALMKEFSKNINPNEIKILKKWHGVMCLDKCYYQRRRKDWLSIPHTLLNAWKFDIFFPLLILRRLFAKFRTHTFR